VKLVTHLPSKPVYVIGDPGQIEQIFINLITNGGEAIGDKQGAIVITISVITMWRDELIHYGRITNTTLSEGGYALIEVSEHGIGMSKETLDRMFDPFFTTKFTGRGLGLSAVLGIIKGHKGGVTVESKEGEGTTIRVILPVVTSPVLHNEPIHYNKRSKTTEGKIILVIDDELDIATMAQEILESAAYTVLTELNPVRGIALYKQHHSDIGLVLLDMTMPEMSGKEAVDALQAIDPDVKIIISSGYTEEEVGKKIGRAKISGFIQKPYRVQSLVKIVHSVIQNNTV
jgi:CheY-like chemotaxis protein